MSPIGVTQLHGVSAATFAAASRAGLDRPLRYEAELVFGAPIDDAVVLGAMQRAAEVGRAVSASGVLLQRGSGGAEARVGPGTLWMQLALARPDALVACPPDRLMNRHVRPLLRALTKLGALAHYFDRDWVSVAKRPVGAIAFAHDATTGRALVEAMIAVRTPFAVRERASFLGKEPATLESLGVSVDPARLGEALVDAYRAAHAREMVVVDAADVGVASAGDPYEAEPAWTATRDEAIGIVAAGRDRNGRMRIGGELLVSRDAVARLEERLAVMTAPDADEIGRAVDESLQARGVALFGVRSLVSVRDALVEAFARG